MEVGLLNYSDWSGGSETGSELLRIAQGPTSKQFSFYIYGGLLKDKVLADFYAFGHRIWRKVEDKNGGTKQHVKGASLSSGPGSRHSATLVAHSPAASHIELYLFGGHNGAVCLNDVWIFRTKAPQFESGKWTELKCKGEPPAPTMGHSAVVYKDAMYVFGGVTRDDRYPNALYKLDFETGAWAPISFQSRLDRAVPLGRAYSSAVVHNASMWIVSGSIEKSKTICDFYEYQFEKRRWVQHFLPPSFVPRKGHTATLDTANDVMVVLGGQQKPNKLLNSVLTYNFAKRVWKKAEKKSSKGYVSLQTPRAHHATALLPDGSLLVFGGQVDAPIAPNSQPTVAAAAAASNSSAKSQLVTASTCRLAKRKDRWPRYAPMASTPFGELPNEIIEYILKRLEPEDVTSLSQVSTELYNIGGNEAVWKSFYQKIVTVNHMKYKHVDPRFPLTGFQQQDIFLRAEEALRDTENYFNRMNSSLPMYYWRWQSRGPLAWVKQTVVRPKRSLPDPPQQAVAFQEKIDQFLQQQNKSRPINVLMVGSGGCGKSIIVSQWTSRTFKDEWDPTISNHIRHHVMTHGNRYVVDALDTGGSEEFSASNEDIAGTNCVVVTYSIASRASFEEITLFLNRILECRREAKATFGMVLVGTKLDLYHHREVSRKEGLKLATRLDIPFLECSGRTGYLVSETFVEAVREYAITALAGEELKKKLLENLQAVIKDPTSHTPRSSVHLAPGAIALENSQVEERKPQAARRVKAPKAPKAPAALAVEKNRGPDDPPARHRRRDTSPEHKSKRSRSSHHRPSRHHHSQKKREHHSKHSVSARDRHSRSHSTHHKKDSSHHDSRHDSHRARPSHTSSSTHRQHRHHHSRSDSKPHRSSTRTHDERSTRKSDATIKPVEG